MRCGGLPAETSTTNNWGAIKVEVPVSHESLQAGSLGLMRSAL